MLSESSLCIWKESGGVLYFAAPHSPYVGPIDYVLCEKHKGNIYPITGHEDSEGK
jgi:hypothetical protein